MKNIKLSNETRIARAAARAEAAAEKIEKILSMLEVKVQQIDELDESQSESVIHSERLEASEEAIMELAMVVAEMEG